jgi:predicted chitinase
MKWYWWALLGAVGITGGVVAYRNREQLKKYFVQFPKETIKLIRIAFHKYGLDSRVMQAGILAVVSTEGSFYAKTEIGFGNTSNDRIRAVFGSRIAGVTDAELTVLKKNDAAFFDKVYGGQYGNNKPGDGYKYRGRGFNGITFKDVYARIGKLIGIDLVAYPEKLEQPSIAAEALAAYFIDNLKTGERSGRLKAKFGIDKISDIKTKALATKVAFQANAGWGTNLETAVLQHEHANQLKNVEALYAIVNA